MEVFLDGLPGTPDNLSFSPDGNIFVSRAQRIPMVLMVPNVIHACYCVSNGMISPRKLSDKLARRQ